MLQGNMLSGVEGEALGVGDKRGRPSDMSEPIQIQIQVTDLG